jgi:hypothetical protein
MFVFVEAINGYFRMYIVTEIDFFFYSISSSVTITTAPPPPLPTTTTNDDDDSNNNNNNNNNTNTLQFCAIILQFAASVPPHSPIRAVSS